nr:MAG TPA: hypothetical protein [Caudoviricetes sp.]
MFATPPTGLRPFGFPAARHSVRLREPHAPRLYP